MLSAKEIKSLAERVAKAEQLVADGKVHPVAGLEDYYVVVNGSGESYYLVHVKADEVACSCPDYTQRQQAAGQACKHGHAVMIYRERPVAPAEPKTTKGKTDTDAVQAEPRPKVDGAAGLARLRGEDGPDPWNVAA